MFGLSNGAAGGELLFDAAPNGHGNVGPSGSSSGGASGAATPTPSGSGSSAFDLNDFPILGGQGGGGPGVGAPGGGVGSGGVGGGGSGDGLAAALRQQQQLLQQQQQLMSQQQLQQQPGGVVGGGGILNSGGKQPQSNLYRIATAGQGTINIATEDFPALPGSGGIGAPGSGLLGTGGVEQQQQQQRNSSGSNNNPESGTSSPYFGAATPTESRTPSNGSGGLGLFGGSGGGGDGLGADGAGGPSGQQGQMFDGGLLGGGAGGGLGGFGNIGGAGGAAVGSASSPRPSGSSGGGGGNPSSSSGAPSTSSGGGGDSVNPASSGGGAALSSDFGLLGLLSIIRMTDADRNALALGSDLTSLGLNLKSSDKLYNTFASPWSDSPTTREPQYQLPMCYYMQPPALKTGHLSKFQLETLFYIFYALPKDVLQAYSAQELYSREWRNHVELKLWFKRAGPGDGVAAADGGGGNSGSSNGNSGDQYIYFDTNTWERRLFNGNVQNITSGLLSEDDVRVKFPSS